MTKDLPPEEKLLRLIKGVYKKDKPEEKSANQGNMDAAEDKRSVADRRKTDYDRRAAGAREDIEAKRVKPKIKIAGMLTAAVSKGKKLDAFKITAIAMIALVVAGIAYFSYEFFVKEPEQPIVDIERFIPADEQTGKPIQAAQSSAANKEPIDEEPAEHEAFFDISEPEEAVQMRQLFGAPATRDAAPIMEMGPSISELAMDLVLLGVITGDNPQAILEDKKTHQTFYVYEGENVSVFKIKKIEKAVVILEYNGETIKLTL